jgi:hypothetical protein
VRLAFAAALLLAACGERAAEKQADSPGARLEVAARDAGLIPGENASLVGSWARDTDRLCVVPGSRGDYRIGAVVDYGEGQSCAAAGTASRSGGKLDIRFGDCRFVARIDGDRIAFPAELPVDCERVCAGRASLAAVTVDRVSASAAEASTLKLGTGKPLCTT